MLYSEGCWSQSLENESAAVEILRRGTKIGEVQSSESSSNLPPKKTTE